jgi:hypothetical protein
MKSGKLHSSPRIGLIFYIAVSLLCGTMAENALGQESGPRLGRPLQEGEEPRGPVPPPRSRDFEPQSPFPKGLPECVPDILGLCKNAIDPETPGIDQILTAMFQGQCNSLRESCVSLRASCTEGSGNQLRRSFIMILNNERNMWCLVDPQNFATSTHGPDNCLTPEQRGPNPVDLCRFLVPEFRSNPRHPCECKLIGGIPDVGQIIVPETKPYACARKELKTLSECNSCCSTAGAEFFPDETDRDKKDKWVLDCQGSCKNYPRG